MCYNGFKNYDEMFSNVHANRFGLTETCSIYLKKKYKYYKSNEEGFTKV
jgi:hypothetical protein